MSKTVTPGHWSVVFHGFVDPARPYRIVNTEGDAIGWAIGEADAKAVVDEHNARLIQMEMGWHAEKMPSGKWAARDEQSFLLHRDDDTIFIADDPATAILMAYRWRSKHKEPVTKEAK
jgi:hypothetical protein